tara:strand:- start:2917 stop:3591 length:675 start_codon:yes stop_codon:yes gene_type:complete
MSSQTQSASETTKRCHHPRSTATITPSSSSVRRILHLKNSVFDLSKAADKKSSSKKKKSEHFQCVKIKGDGRCMFRALALGLAHLSKHNMTSSEETKEADTLRNAVFEQMCRDEEKRKGHSEASMSIKYGDPDGIEGYCRRIQKEDFWGGETELLVLAKLIRRPIMVYLPAHMAKNAASGSGYVCIQTYGEEYASKMNKKTGKVTERAPVRLLYNGQTHYDLLI